jgi:hypothetical protein
MPVPYSFPPAITISIAGTGSCAAMPPLKAELILIARDASVFLLQPSHPRFDGLTGLVRKPLSRNILQLVQDVPMTSAKQASYIVQVHPESILFYIGPFTAVRPLVEAMKAVGRGLCLVLFDEPLESLTQGGKGHENLQVKLCAG